MSSATLTRRTLLGLLPALLLAGGAGPAQAQGLTPSNAARTSASTPRPARTDGRTYFWARPKTPGASYRVTIHSGDWTRTGGGSDL